MNVKPFVSTELKTIQIFTCAVSGLVKPKAMWLFWRLRLSAKACIPPRRKAMTQCIPAQGEVWQGQGGYYIGTMPPIKGTPGYHLVRAQEEAKDLEYGGSGHDTPGAASQHDGASNTAALLADSKPHPAAQWAASVRAEDHADFYLPSRAELFLAWLCAPHLFKKSGYYWSSTQYSRRSACVQDFEYGGSGWLIKDGEFRAVAVRRIPLL